MQLDALRPEPLSKLPILVKEGDRYYKYAKVDLLDGGNGLLIYDYHSGEKVSRHSDGNVYARIPGTGSSLAPTTTIPFSQIEREVVRSVPIPSDTTVRGSTYSGDVSRALVFSSTVLRSNGTFAAEIVADAQLVPVLASWRNHPRLPERANMATYWNRENSHSVGSQSPHNRFVIGRRLTSAVDRSSLTALTATT